MAVIVGRVWAHTGPHRLREDGADHGCFARLRGHEMMTRVCADEVQHEGHREHEVLQVELD